METVNIHVKTKKLLADTLTPVGLYLNLRDRFYQAFLLESSDYHGNDNNYSFVCIDPLASFVLENDTVTETVGDQTETVHLSKKQELIPVLQQFTGKFRLLQEEDSAKETAGANGFFGYTAYDAVQYFETITLQAPQKAEQHIPVMHYTAFRFVLRFDHFKNELLLIENRFDGEVSQMEKMESLLHISKFPGYGFRLAGEKTSNLTDSQFMEMVKKGKEHCQRGDVFQIVLSRQFSQGFTGDEFNVYRTLRSVNPSPYLFYFDYGSFKLFGSSPEAQLKVNGRQAVINPIAGTFRRSGNDEKDKQLAEQLSADPKENAEHTMLVDLARNDLSRHGGKVEVKTFKEVQYYSHVIHLVSEVTAELDENADALQLFADTFPAGTLSGAPKYKAMELIDRYENQSRGFYGGAIGIFGFDGSLNHAITIRSFLSKNNRLYFQAGAGVVVSSVEENELQEINNKLGALLSALEKAEKLTGKKG
ncbi:anthranilate synthase component I family protein [Candidatus Sulfidibacterium hydrothermale]|uniref:anthranilate synthase component I family protein n=1 Tax=Candidatus Sulfidibacterium hydrothermale TaxID=2875962 RepID=UPI001F0B5049|nr:anthranilate synthase component I family protein [Candidatus Sulfidibacterium hydrothermale]UBM63014.1 anthranilate synthase component I family protein [Candidatus Sulfidibacterium hydrothermale]